MNKHLNYPEQLPTDAKTLEIWRRVEELRKDPKFQRAVAEEIEISRTLLDMLAET